MKKERFSVKRIGEGNVILENKTILTKHQVVKILNELYEENKSLKRKIKKR